MKKLEGAIKYVKEQRLYELALAYMQKGQPSTSRKELATIKKPVLVICGTEDEDNGSSKALRLSYPDLLRCVFPEIITILHARKNFRRRLSIY